MVTRGTSLWSSKPPWSISVATAQEGLPQQFWDQKTPMLFMNQSIWYFRSHMPIVASAPCASLAASFTLRRTYIMYTMPQYIPVHLNPEIAKTFPPPLFPQTYHSLSIRSVR